MLKKPPLILIHGFCENAEVWKPVLKKLPKDIEAYAIDLPGYGKNPPASHLSMLIFSEAILNFIQKKSIIKPVLIGHSMGGYVVLNTVKNNPDSFSGLGLFHSSALPDGKEKKENRLKTLAFLDKFPLSEFFKTFIPGLVSRSKEKADFLPEVKALVYSTPVETVKASIKAMYERSSSEKFIKNTDLPVMILAGVYDKIIPIEFSRFQASLPSRCFYKELSESGHLSMFEESQEAATAISDFINWVN